MSSIVNTDYIKGDVIGDLNLAVPFGNISEFSSVDKFGINPTIDPATDPEDMWEFGGVYPYDDDNTAPIQYVSSDDASDTGQEISVDGLDINGLAVSQTITTNGQSNVTLSTPLWRVYRMENNSDVGGDIVGTLYCHTDATPTAGVPLDANVRAIITGSNNQTLMCVYTIPADKVAFLFRGEFGVELEGNAAALAEYARCHYESRRFGKVFKIKKSVTLMVGGAATYVDNRVFPDIIPGKTDIKLTIEQVSDTMGLWGTFDLLLVDQDYFSQEYLQAIGQPGA